MKIILLITQEGLIVFDLNQRHGVGALQFKTTPEEQAKFAAYIGAKKHHTVQLLLDLAGEDFKLERMPHRRGRDKKLLQQRLVAKHFGPAEFYGVQTQCRANTNRRDVQVLIAGIIDTAPISPWWAILRQQHIPLSGIYSLALIAPKVLAQLAIDDDTVLLVSQQNETDFRHSLYQKRRLVLSRMIQLHGDNQRPQAEVIANDVHKTLQFCTYQQQHQSKANIATHLINVVAVNKADLICALQNKGIDNARFHQTKQQGAYFTYLPYIYALATARFIKTHYGQRKHLMPYYQKLIVRGNYAMTLFAVLTTLGYTLWTWAHHIDTEHAIALNDIEYDAYQKQIHSQTAMLSAFDYTPSTLRNSVDLIRQLQQANKATPEPLLNLIANSIAPFHSIEIGKITWSSTTMSPWVATDQRATATVVAHIKATAQHVGLKQIQMLVARLKQHPDIESVQVDNLPSLSIIHTDNTAQTKAQHDTHSQVHLTISTPAQGLPR